MINHNEDSTADCSERARTATDDSGAAKTVRSAGTLCSLPQGARRRFLVRHGVYLCTAAGACWADSSRADCATGSIVYGDDLCTWPFLSAVGYAGTCLSIDSS